jgi:hypothetical protein
LLTLVALRCAEAAVPRTACAKEPAEAHAAPIAAPAPVVRNLRRFIAASASVFARQASINHPADLFFSGAAGIIRE